ncbi:MAG: potassium channel family protein [Verrucomicrobiota bacterium]
MITQIKQTISSHRSLPLCLWLIFAVASSPFRGFGDWRNLLSAALLTFGLAACAIHLRASRRFHISMASATVILLLSILAELALSTRVGLETVIYLTILFIELSILYLLIKHAFKSEPLPRADRIASALGGYVLLAFVWTGIYILITLHQPNAFINILTNEPPTYQTLFYYSMITLTTQGYGDILPQTTLSRYCAGFEGLVGTFYIAVLVASLINQATSKENSST